MIVQNNIVWEAHDHFQKQTYRNRCYISTNQGKHSLIIPIKHTSGKKGQQKYKEVEMDHPSHWKRQHWRTLKTAYSTSPFFEFYEDDIKPLFEGDEKYLYAFNLKALEIVGYCLGLQIPDKKTELFEKQPLKYVDTRFLVNAKKEPVISLEPYSQVFEERHGFIPNLSILDLLFNEGPNTLAYLKRQSLNVPGNYD